MDSKWWRIFLGRAALVVAGPLVFFAGVEGVLFLTGKFEPVRVIERVEQGGRGYWASVPEFGEFALRRNPSPQPQQVWVPVEKKPGTLRVVVVGESAAAGFPGPEFSLARLVDALWRERFPDRPIEVVNLTMVGVSSHILRRFVDEAVKMEPDAVVFYLGHNEAIGPYGPVSRLAGFYPAGWMAQASLTARNTRTGRFLEWAAGRLSERKTERAWQGLGEFSGARLAADDAVLDVMVQQTKQNVRAMAEGVLEAGGKVLVCVPAVNLTDWPPVASAAGSEERSAEAAYAMAQELAKAGNMAEAWKLYRKACDWDEMRFRADSRVRGVQREVVAEMASPDVALVDADLWLHEKNPGPLTDRDFFLEHVHLTFAGRVAVAELIVDGLGNLLNPSEATGMDAASWWEHFPKTVETARTRTLFTELHASRMLGAADSVVGTSVFAGMADIQNRRSRLASHSADLDKKSRQDFNEAEFMTKHAQAAASNPADPWPDVIASQVLYVAGQQEKAREFIRSAQKKSPVLADGLLGLCLEELRAGRMDMAMEHLKEMESLWPKHELIPRLYSEILEKGGDIAQAVPHLKRRAQNNPNDFLLWSNLAMAQQKKGDFSEAAESYRRGLTLKKNDTAMLNNLAWILATKPDGSEEERGEAVELAERAIAINPLANRLRGTLAVALLADGRVARGRLEAKKAISIARAGGDEEAVRELESRLAQLDRAVEK